MMNMTSEQLECLILMWLTAAACGYVGYLIGRNGTWKP